jgi:hypothetical protein
MEKFVTIAVFQYPAEAYVLKAKLEAYDIPVFLRDEFTVQSHNFYSNAVGGVKLQVMESDVDKAKDLITSTELIEEQDIPDSENLVFDSPAKNSFNILTIVLIALLVVALAIIWYF